MYANPKPGDLVRVLYGKRYRHMMPYQGREGVICIVCKAKRCRNHGVMIGRKLVVIPCGNLFKIKEPTK